MPGDAARGNDDELLSQIDELKARMDRLMRGGTSTSNSALLTDPPKPTASPVVEAQPAPAPPPPRTPVRDLIGSQETETVEEFANEREVVAFPDEVDTADEKRPADRPSEEGPSSPPPPSKPKPSAVGGSVISVDEGRSEPRPHVESFDDIGNAIEQELARDASVPPASSPKGPDLASRFGPVDEPEDPAELVEAVVPDEADVAGEQEEDGEDYVEEEAEVYTERSRIGAIVAIWVFTAVTSGAIATLHFTGII